MSAVDLPPRIASSTGWRQRVPWVRESLEPVGCRLALDPGRTLGPRARAPASE